MTDARRRRWALRALFCWAVCWPACGAGASISPVGGDVRGAAGDPRELALAGQATGRAAYVRGEAPEAEAHLRGALAAARRLDPADPELETDLVIDLVTVLASLGELVEAESLIDGLGRLTGAGADPRRAYRIASASGTLRHQAGDLLGALERRRQALEAAAATGEAAPVATALTNLAQTEARLHDYASALDRLRRALEIEERPYNRIIALVETGICHLELNQLDEAEAAFDRAAELAGETGDHRLEGWALGERGLVEWRRGRAETALELFDRAIASCRRAGDRRSEIVWWTNKGRVRRDQQRWGEALSFYRQAERLERSIPGQRASANLSRQIGQCQAGLGRLDLAEELFREALDLARRAGDARVAWETRRELARLYAATGRPEAAREAWRETLDGIEAIRGSLGLESLETDFFNDKVEVYAEAIAFLLASGGEDGRRSAFEVVERSRARAFLGSLAEARAGLHETLPAELVAEERRLLGEISRLQAADRRGQPDPERRSALAAAEAALEALELRFRAERPRFSEMRGLAPAGLADVQRALEPGEVLLEYFLAEPESHLWVVEPDRLRYFALPPAATIEDGVRRGYTELLDPDSTPGLGDLAQHLLAPFAETPAAPGTEVPETLLIVPSGILHYLPFEALPLGHGYLADRTATSYLPSASALVELRRRPAAPPAARLLAVGDAPYRGAPEPAASRGPLGGLRSLGALPHTRREVERIGARFGRRSSTVLLGTAAAEGRLTAEPLDRYSVLHLAVHGWIDPSSAARCGLVLGAGPGEDDDGLLQFREILRLRLAADLVTLSACQSALGELVTGEGMVGLARAFFYAGSDSVVASLWSVADDATADLMAEFYRGLAEGLPKAEALRRARLAVRADPRYAHPYYWASFVLLGRGEDGVEIPRRGPAAIPVTLAAVAAVCGLGLLGWKLRRRRRELEVRAS